MLSRYFGSNTHYYLHLLGLFGLAFGIPLNKVVMSISMLFLALNFLLEGNFKDAWQRLKSNVTGWFIFGFLALHLIAFLWTSNLEYGLHDLRVKLPLLVIPLILIARPLKARKDLHLVLLSFMGSTLLVSLVNFAMYQHWIGNHNYDDIRGMSLSSSHVRFAIIVAFCVAICLYFLKYTRVLRFPLFLIIAWFAYYTFFSQVISGASTLAGVFLVFFVYLLWGKRKIIALVLLGGSMVAIASLSVWLFAPVHIDPALFDQLPAYTAEGNPYVHYNRLISPESGEPIYINFCEKELARDWPKRSKIPYYGLDEKEQPVRFTLLRYLASRGLTKDAAGLASLSKKEIETIESGIGSARNYGLWGRLYSIKYQLINEQNPNGNSLLQRVEYWRAGSTIFSKNCLLGVGTGDVQDAFDQHYVESASSLDPENRKRAHNMYLTVALSFGVLGLLLFFFFHGHFLRQAMARKELLAVLFLTVALISFLMEDTLETQTGVTFCALFYALFATRIPQRKEAE
ncbi:MAG: hypothetical protein A3D92_15920 [Bacteroidetes bacterium RIFCSPHIGHO2_02_FULL_44_7]|nr:MAG: hypothetical protein A3D92_15920 [Bacteroidetes bacterium RIFCSPHIGHO2_02_FULL_44_7]